jgi:V8-like Glu-specific endopeptidase
MRWRALIFIATAFLFAGFFSSALAQSVAGTTWISDRKIGGRFATITFAADGQYSETWKKKHTVGTWQASANNQQITVTLIDKFLQFSRTADGNLLRAQGRVIFKPGTAAAAGTASASDDADTAPPAPDRNVPTVKLTEDQARAVVLIKGDTAEGTGFLVKTASGPVVVTNIHVISNNPNLKITTNTGAALTIVSTKGATDRDLAEIAIKDGDYKYLELANDISGTVQPGDEVITPGNSEGGEVMLNTDGKVLGIGPDRLEFDNPIYHGNSGGPVFHVKSGKVIAVVTEAIKVDTSNALDKASFANRSSAIGHSMRYFGMRLDTVPAWEAFDDRRFQNETAFLDQFDHRSKCLDCYLNAPNDSKPEDVIWREDKEILKDNDEFFAQAGGGADIAQQVNADRIMWSEFNDIAGTDMDTITKPENFYSFDRTRAADEAAYRKAIRAELKEISNNVGRLGSLPRTNN